MTLPPGARAIDPAAEAERLAADRLGPPAREWGVRHPGGHVSVSITGQAFISARAADQQRADCDERCDWCEGGAHTLVWRDRPPWREWPPGDDGYSEAAQ